MFVNSDYLNYKYVVEVSDNYIVLTNRSSVNGSYQSPQEIDIIYQYLEPSFLTIKDTVSYSRYVEFSRIDIDDNFFSRSDSNLIIYSQLAISFLFIFCFNALTRFCRKGGIFFGK